MTATAAPLQIPKTGLAGLRENWRYDIVAGFQSFLIALPLCLGIAMASKFPPMAGIIAAMVGGLLVSRINGSYVTISGPAAGLIVVTLGAVESLGGGDPVAAYHRTLAAIVCAGILQMVICAGGIGRLMALVPVAVVEGMLAAIGIIIMAKQYYVMIGVKPEGELLESIAAIPASFLEMNPELATIGLSGLALLILWEILRPRIRLMEWIPAPIVVVSLGLGLGLLFDLDHHHKYSWHSTLYAVGPESLLPVPQSFWDGFAFPDFSMIGTGTFWIAVVSICLVSTLESLLSAAAIDKLDPYQRQSDLGRDGAALGFGSAISGAIGGLPMISEIVRSSANIRFGARTGWANFFHAVFLLVFVALFPGLIHEVPKAALGALLVFTGYKLASPRQFLSVWAIGKEQLFLFVFTIFAVLATDLLIGVGLGIVAKVVLHVLRGVNFKQLFKIDYHIDQPDPTTYHVRIDGAAIFSNFLALKSVLSRLPWQKQVVFDLSRTVFIDHTVMDLIHEFCRDYVRRGGSCEIQGLENHEPASDHPLAARRRRSLKHLLGLFLQRREQKDQIEFRVQGADILRRVLAKLEEDLNHTTADKKVVIDLSEAEFLSSSMLAAIQNLCQTYEKRGGRCEIRGLAPSQVESREEKHDSSCKKRL